MHFITIFDPDPATHVFNTSAPSSSAYKTTT